MPYKNNSDLPDKLKNILPQHAQDIYREAFNHALEEYKNPEYKRNKGESTEAIAHKVAWSAVKNKYTKGEDNKWHSK